MLIIFKSKAAAEIVMYKEHAQRILDILGKDINRGIITKAETQRAIEAIEAAIAESRAHPVSSSVRHDVDIHPQPNDTGDHDHEPAEGVSFATRAYPLLQMLKAASDKGSDVVWGV